MSKFIELTIVDPYARTYGQVEHKRIILNTEHIMAIQPYKKGCEIYTASGVEYSVVEDTQTVMAAIGEEASHE